VKEEERVLLAVGQPSPASPVAPGQAHPPGPPPGTSASGDAPDLPPPRRRRSALLARSPAFAALALAACAWLLWDWAPEVAWFFAPATPVDLGAPGAFHLERARENRLAQVRGPLTDEVGVTVGRTGEERTVGRLAGTNLLVDRPGPPGRAITDVYEGRLLPPRARGDYAEAAAALRRRGAPLGDRFEVLRDGERPRQRWLPALGSALLVLLAAVNVRALLRAIAE